jgi:transposase-like protein
MWIEQNEGASNLWFAFWMGIMNELKNRGVKDILLAAVDGLTGFPGAITAVFPKTEVQLCLRTLVRVHRVRNSLRFVPYKDRKAVTAGLKTVYPAPQAEAAAFAPEEFAGVWDKKYPMITKSWRSRWAGIIPFFKFSPACSTSGSTRFFKFGFCLLISWRAVSPPVS